MNSWESPRLNLTKGRLSSSGFCRSQLQEHLQPTKRFAADSEIVKIFFAGDGGSRGSCERSCGNTIPSHLSCPATISPKRGTRTLAIYSPNKKSPPTRNWPISPKPIVPNKVRAFGGQSAPPSLKQKDFFVGFGCHATFGGQSAPPSLKLGAHNWDRIARRAFGGQSAPPSLKPRMVACPQRVAGSFGGQSAPPSLKLVPAWPAVKPYLLSGGSPPPLH